MQSMASHTKVKGIITLVGGFLDVSCWSIDVPTRVTGLRLDLNEFKHINAQATYICYSSTTTFCNLRV